MTTVSANELKTKGIAAIEAVLHEQNEAVITVRGKPRYVVLDITQYDHLRQSEFEVAWLQSKADYATGRYRQETADEHIDRVKRTLEDGTCC
jgi:prevent-host-death family protein